MIGVETLALVAATGFIERGLDADHQLVREAARARREFGANRRDRRLAARRPAAHLGGDHPTASFVVAVDARHLVAATAQPDARLQLSLVVQRSCRDLQK